jgi:L-alanine-DL-glutamate epimerase-like enolase superfamily enzyme
MRMAAGACYAKSALDIALWDLTGKAAGLPLYALLGGRRQADLPLYHSITCVEPDEMARIAREAQAQRHHPVPGQARRIGRLADGCGAAGPVREAVGPGPLVYGDWNCGATSLDATRVGRAARTLDVMLEQPCATLEDCARVRAATGLPMKLDELAHDTATLLEAHRQGIMDAVALKLSKFGGLSALRRARDLCLHLGAKMCIEDTWGSDIATAAALHLGAATDPARCSMSATCRAMSPPALPRMRRCARLAASPRPRAPALASPPTPRRSARPT